MALCIIRVRVCSLKVKMRGLSRKGQGDKVKTKAYRNVRPGMIGDPAFGWHVPFRGYCTLGNGLTQI